MRRIGWGCTGLGLLLLAAVVWAGTTTSIPAMLDGTGRLVPRAGLPLILQAPSGQDLQLQTSGGGSATYNGTALATTTDLSAHTGASTNVHGIPDTATVPYPPVRVVATSNLTLSNPATDTVDGVVLTTGQRLLLTGQTAGSENGIYTFDTSSTPLTRGTDMDASAEVRQATVYVQEGTDWARSAWQLTTTGAITLGTTALTFESVRLFQDATGALTPLRPAAPLLIQPDTDQNVEVTTSGAGIFEYNNAEVLTGPYTLQDAFDAGTEGSKGRITGCSITERCEYRGATLKYQVYENAGAWFVEVRQISDDALIAIHRNIGAGLTHEIQGDGTPIVSFTESTLEADFSQQLKLTGGTGTPTSTDCDAAGEARRIYIQTDAADASMLWVCKGASGWQQQTGGGAALTVTEEDDSPSVSNVTEIRVTNGTLTDNTGGSVSISTGGGGGPVAPIRPASAIPVTAGMVYGCIIDGDELMCVADATTLTSDAIWRLNFEMPPTLATGCTYKLQLDMKANAATGVMRINPKWNTWAPGVTRTSLTLNAETVTPDSVTGAAGSGDTVTLGTGDENQLIRIKWTLNASTVTAAQRIAMDLTFEDASTTLAVQSGYLASVICE